MQHVSQEQRVFPLSQYVHCESFRHYYAFGNSPAEDFLQSVVPSECRRPSILSLGGGDMRSILFTIFKNFGFEGTNSDGFEGVNFVLNDCSAAVLARNILFLYLCMYMPENDVSKFEGWIASMWSIWFNHELLPQHDAMLSSALAQLIRWSCTWREWYKCPLGGVVQFSSSATFTTVKKVWDQWHSDAMTKSVHEIKSARNAFQYHHLKNTYGDYPSREAGLKAVRDNHLNSMLRNGLFLHSSEKLATMNKEYLYYLTEGTVWAENILDIPIIMTVGTVMNPTLFEHADGMYTLHYSLTPYNCFAHSFQYTSAEVSRTCQKQSALFGQLPVSDCHFRSKPLLANSVQQFSMWLEATAHLIKKSSCKVTVMFDLDDSINLCCSLLCHPDKYSKSFDAIYTSNLFDHVSPPVLVLSSLPLLKSTGTLFTATFKFTSRKYLEKMFGFSPELFPPFLNIHCVGQDGNYSSPVNPEPCPNPISCRMIFPWRNVNSQSLIFDNIEETPISLESLLRLCITSYLQPLGSAESFLCVLHQFLLQFKSHPSHNFLKSLGSAIQNTHELKPHLMQLQTQSLLHGIHMHITLMEDDCPLCRGQPLDSYIQQFSISFDIDCNDVHVDEPAFELYLANFRVGVVSAVTSIDVNSSNSTFELIFFLPKPSLLQYNIVKVDMFQNGMRKCVFVGAMDSLKKSSAKFLFLKDLVKPYTTEEHGHTTSLGSIVKHIGDGCSFKTVICMSETCQAAVKVSKLKPKCLEDNQLLLYCGTLTSPIIVYPYVIDESTVTIGIKENKISVTINRAHSEFYKEKTTYYTDPSSALTIPIFHGDENAIEMYCELQALLLNIPDHPVSDAKISFMELFRHAMKGQKLFTLFPPSQHLIGEPHFALVYVHNLRFSTAFSSPALDVSYCFLDTKLDHRSESCMDIVGASTRIIVTDMEYKFLKDIFNFFSAITYCAFSSDKHTVTLPARYHGLLKHFDRAILFPLYPNPAHPNLQEIMAKGFSLHMLEGIYIGYSCLLTVIIIFVLSLKSISIPSETGSEITEMPSGSITCTRCNRPSTINCLCGAAFYCSTTCQNLDWLEHSKKCKQLVSHSERDTEASNISTVCARCKKPASITCSCKALSYCSKACQTLEWPEHSKKHKQPACNYHSHESLKANTPSSKAVAHAADSKVEPTAYTLFECSNCKKTKWSLKYCKCRNVLYCSVECQRLHWPQHKSTCVAVKK